MMDENRELKIRFENRSKEFTCLERRFNIQLDEYKEIKSRLEFYEYIKREESKREESRDVVVLESHMSNSMKNDAIETVKSSLNRFKDDSDRADYIQDHFNNKYGKYWGCIIGKSFISQIYYRKDNMISFTIGNRKIILYKFD